MLIDIRNKSSDFDPIYLDLSRYFEIPEFETSSRVKHILTYFSAALAAISARLFLLSSSRGLIFPASSLAVDLIDRVTSKS